MKTLLLTRLFVLRKIYGISKGTGAISGEIFGLLKEFYKLFSYTYTVYDEVFVYLRLLSEEQVIALVSFVDEKRKAETSFAIKKRVIIDSNRLKLEHYLLNFDQISIPEAFTRCNQLFNTYLKQLDEVLGADGAVGIEKGEWRFVDEYIVLAAEICLVRRR